MGYIQGQVSIPANSVNGNVIAGDQFEFADVRSATEFGLVASAIGLEVDVLVAGRTVVTRMLPSQANRVPVYPDDFPVRGGCFPGERRIIRGRNTTGGALTLFFTVKDNPV